MAVGRPASSRPDPTRKNPARHRHKKKHGPPQARNCGLCRIFGKSTTSTLNLVKIKPRHDGPTRHDSPWLWAYFELFSPNRPDREWTWSGPGPRPSLIFGNKALKDPLMKSWTAQLHCTTLIDSLENNHELSKNCTYKFWWRKEGTKLWTK